MKIYDKEMYNKEQNIKSIVLIIVVFLLGFFTGYIANNITTVQEGANNLAYETNQIENVENSNQN